MPRPPRDVAEGPILLKKSVGAVALIFLAPWKGFEQKDAGGLIAERQRDLRRSKWNCYAKESRL